MDPTPSPEPTVVAQSIRRQPPYNFGEQQANPSKKRKTASEDEIRRVEEVILLLSAIERMRGGRDPTMAEKSMMSEAKTTIVSLCEDSSPKNILPYDYESFRVLIDDLGLSRLKEHFLGFCTPELSISERFHHAKRMDEKSYANQPASYPSQRLQNGEAACDHHGMPSKVHVLDSKVPEHPGWTSSMDYMNRAVNCPFCKVTINGVESVLVCDACEKGYHLGCLQPYNVKGVPRGEWHCPKCLSMNREDQFPPKYFRVTRNMYAPKAPSNATGVQPSSEEKVETVQPMRTQLIKRTNSGTKNNVRDHPVRTDGNVALNAPQKTALASTGPTVNPAAALNTPVSIPAVHHPLQGVQAVHGSSPHNHHTEISKLVQRVLDSKVLEHPGWTSSRDYMNRAVNCPLCKVTIYGVESVLVCDFCDKGYHLGCLQSYNVKDVPRGEWHCPRCLSVNRGNQFPPKYGRVTRNMYAPMAPSNATGVQLSSKKKVETVQPMRTQLTQRTNCGTKNNVWAHPVRTDDNIALNTPQKTALASAGPTVKPAAAQNTPVSIPTVHHPVQGVQAVHGSSPHNRHPEISKLVLEVLDSKVPEHRGWTSSMNYMNRAVNCPFCKVTINGVDSVLVCDACEKRVFIWDVFNHTMRRVFLEVNGIALGAWL